MGDGGEKCSKTFFRNHNLQNQAISKLYTDNNKSKYSSNHKNIFKSEKKIMKNFIPRRQIQTLLLLDLLAKLITERKSLMNYLIFARQNNL